MREHHDGTFINMEPSAFSIFPSMCTFRLCPTPHASIPHNSLPIHLVWWKDLTRSRRPILTVTLVWCGDGPEGQTLTSKKRALPKPISHSIQSEGLTKLPHSYCTVDGLTTICHCWASKSLCPSLKAFSKYVHTRILSHHLYLGPYQNPSTSCVH